MQDYNSQHVLLASGDQGMLGIVVLHRLEVALPLSVHSNIPRVFTLQS